MELFGKPAIVSEHSHVIFLSSVLCPEDGQTPTHKCDFRCQNERLFGNMYRCRLTGISHICDSKCDQRILYDNHSSLCRVSGQVFPLSPSEAQAVRGVRRKIESERGEASEGGGGGCGFKKRRRESPFERSYGVIAPIPTQPGDHAMDMMS